MLEGGADIRYIQEMLGHASASTPPRSTPRQHQTLAAVHARSHPHGKLGPEHDMHGKVTPPESRKEDFASPATGNPLHAASMTTACAPIVPATAQAEPETGSPPRMIRRMIHRQPSSAPKSPNPPPMSGAGGKSCNSLPSSVLNQRINCGKK